MPASRSRFVSSKDARAAPSEPGPEQVHPVGCRGRRGNSRAWLNYNCLLYHHPPVWCRGRRRPARKNSARARTHTHTHTDAHTKTHTRKNSARALRNTYARESPGLSRPPPPKKNPKKTPKKTQKTLVPSGNPLPAPLVPSGISRGVGGLGSLPMKTAPLIETPHAKKGPIHCLLSPRLARRVPRKDGKPTKIN